MSQQKYPKAYEAYQQAVYRDGRNPTFWCSIGVLYYQINQYRDALDAYSRAIRLNPYISEVWYDLGTLVSYRPLLERSAGAELLTSFFVFFSMNRATTRPTMLSMPINVPSSWIPRTNTSNRDYNSFGVVRAPACSFRHRRLLHKMFTLRRIRLLR